MDLSTLECCFTELFEPEVSPRERDNRQVSAASCLPESLQTLSWPLEVNHLTKGPLWKTPFETLSQSDLTHFHSRASPTQPPIFAVGALNL